MNLYYTKLMRNGRFRLKQIVGQAITCWRGSNDKTTTVRDEDGKILEFSSKESAKVYCKQRFNATALDESEVD